MRYNLFGQHFLGNGLRQLPEGWNSCLAQLREGRDSVELLNRGAS